jgi:hypothetical protein
MEKKSKITKAYSIFYKTESTRAEAPGVVLAPATRHSPAHRPNKQTPGTILTSTTQHSFQPKDFLKILAAIPADSRYVSDTTRPVLTQNTPSTKKGWKMHITRCWIKHAPTPAPYHLKSTIRLSRLSPRQHHNRNGFEEDLEDSLEID